MFQAMYKALHVPRRPQCSPLPGPILSKMVSMQFSDTSLASEVYFTSLPESCVHGIWHDVQLNHEGEERKRCGEIPRGTSTDYAMLQVRTCNPLWGMSILWT
jgi:hypothetical protein